jgi:hypothetical protein
MLGEKEGPGLEELEPEDLVPCFQLFIFHIAEYMVSRITITASRV